ncbi:MAG: endonuclease/exonuclease/phosphatase family protein [Chitinophagaceae bacterium]
MPKSLFRIYTKKIFVTLQVLLILFFLLGCLLPYLPIYNFWWGGFIGIALPYCTILLFLSILFWLIVKPRFVLLCLFALLLGFKQISVMFGVNFKSTFSNTKNEENIRFVTWNIESFNGLANKNSQKKIIENEILNTLKDLQADIVCFQEFNSSVQNNHVNLLKTVFKYAYFAPDFDKVSNGYGGGSAIFSKYPIINTKQTFYTTEESLLYADVVKDKDTIRVFTTHLKSFKFSKENYNEIENIKTNKSLDKNATKGVIKKMKEAFIKRGSQTKEVVAVLNQNSYPSILCGDFNEVPNNYIYWQLRKNRKDAFIEKGFGLGRTYLHLARTLRIDYILPDDNFEVVQFDMIDEGLSDHKLLVADLKLKKQ